MNWGGDWMCGACQHINFKKREVCQRCGWSKCGGQVDGSAFANTNTNRNEVLAGDWYCQAMNCRAHNYTSRMICFRCGAQRPDVGFGSKANPPSWKSGEWICTRPRSSKHNYACRMEYF
ncbi:Zinc finger protein VAR3 chloroplastic, partial [Bienertia sinuspersici]